MLVKLHNRVRAYENLAFGKSTKQTEKIIEEISEDSAKWSELKIWVALILGNTAILISSIYHDHIYSGLKLIAVLTVFLLLIVLFLRFLKKTLLMYMLIMVPIAFVVITVKRSCKCIKKCLF